MTTRREAVPRLQPAVQALRAIAVAGVVVYHLWPAVLPGGYAGVDVFFVISGYLIIGGILREARRSGRIALGAFWARRARRLAPASLLVLLATGLATVLLTPSVVWQQWLYELGASAIYLENWALAASSVDYLGAESGASPVQHYWSLAVEEQFYIVWPILIALVLLLTRRATEVARARAVLGALVVVTVASFILSVIAVAAGDPAAYFATHTRAWEFGIGGILAVVGVATGRERLRAVVGWTGLVLIGSAFWLFSSQTAFPGLAALVPTLGALLVIWAGTSRSSASSRVLLAALPVQWLGGVSYSWYLWHWPPIVIAGFLAGGELPLAAQVCILVGTLVLAWLTRLVVEDPIRSSARLARAPSALSIVGAITAGAVLVAACALVTVRVDEQREAAQRVAAQALAQAEEDADDSGPQHSCIGAPAALPDGVCSSPYAPTELTNATVAKTDIGAGVTVDDACKQTLEDAAVIACEIGDVSGAATTLALVGDSHAGHLVEALDAWGESAGVRIVTYLKTWCAGTGQPGVAATMVGSSTAVTSCEQWGNAVTDSILADDRVTAVLYANFTLSYYAPDPTAGGRAVTADDFAAVWSRVADSGRSVVAIRDVPTMRPMEVPDCIALSPGVVDPCTLPRAQALPGEDVDPLVLAAAADPDVALVDLSDIYCDETTCHTLIGGLVVYFDGHHLTATFARTLAPILGEAVERALG